MTAAQPNGEEAAHQSERRPGGRAGQIGEERGGALIAGGKRRRAGDGAAPAAAPRPPASRRPLGTCSKRGFPSWNGGYSAGSAIPFARRKRHFKQPPPAAGPAPCGTAALIGRGPAAAPAGHAGKWSPSGTLGLGGPSSASQWGGRGGAGRHGKWSPGRRRGPRHHGKCSLAGSAAGSGERETGCPQPSPPGLARLPGPACPRRGA